MVSGGGDGQTDALRRLVVSRPVVVVRGPAGIGKSTRLRQALAGIEHVVGQSLPSLSSVAYAPLAHALQHWVRGTPTEAAVEVAARTGERVLVLEDVQWADEGTLAVLDQLVGRVRVVLTTRTPNQLELRDESSTFEVQPMSTRAAHSLARRRHPHLSDGRRQALVAAAGGSPLLLESLVDDTAVSPTLTAALLARLARLDDEQRDSLARLALAGGPVPADVIDAAGREAMAGLLTVADGEVFFSHALIGEAVLGLVPAQDRPRLHRELADVMTDRAAAFHLAAAGDLVAAAERAVAAAVDASLPDRAALLSLAVSSRGEDAGVELRLDAAQALLLAHRPAEAASIAETVETVEGIGAATPTDIVTARLVQSQAAWMLGDPTTAARHCAAADELAGEIDDDGIRARVQVERAAQLVRTNIGDPMIIEVATHAVELADRAGIERARARNTLGLAHSHTGRPGWREHFGAAADIARAEGDVEQELAASYWLISSLGLYGPIQPAIPMGEEMLRRAEELGTVSWQHHFLSAHAVHRLGTGTDGRHLIPKLQRLIVQDPMFRNRSQTDLALVVGLTDSGRFDDARAVIAAGQVATRNDEDRSLLCVARAELAWATRDPPAMVDAISDVLTCQRGFFGMNAMLESAAIHLALADPNAEEVPRFPSKVMPNIDVVQTEHDALDAWRDGDATTAIESFDAAAREWATRGFVRFAARAHLGAAILVRRSGRAGERAHLDAAQAIADRWSLVPVQRAIRDARSSARSESARSLVSARERDVLVLVAAGMTSADIGDRLGIGTSTVDTHVKSARLKLGAATRSQAAAMVVGG